MLNSQCSCSPAFPLNADLTDCLLTALPDFQSLQAFIASSKFVYSIFRRRRNSVLGAVAHSQFGPALPQAMHLVRYLDDTHSSGLAHRLQRDAEFGRCFTVTPTQARLLRDHAEIVRALEDIYSWREKDPRSRSSRLSDTESLRFQQSIYRFWLLAAAYGPGAMGDGRPGRSNSDHLWLKDLIIAEQTTFLLNLEEGEFIGVNEVHRFLLDLAKWALLKHVSRPARFRVGLDDRDDIYLVWSGPGTTLDAFRGKFPPFRLIDSQLYGTWRAMTHTFFTSEIASITSRGVLSATDGRHFLLDDFFLRTIDCSRCERLSSLSGRDSLWSLCNWEYMILAISPSRLGSFLSLEKRSPLEFLVSFTEAIQSTPYPQLIKEVFDVRSQRYKDWKRDDWLCTHCMSKLLSGSIQAWFDGRIQTRLNATTNSLVSRIGTEQDEIKSTSLSV